MSKMSQLAAELDELRYCGEILIGISDTLREMFSGGEETPEAQETPVEKRRARRKRQRQLLQRSLRSPQSRKSSSPLRMSGRCLPRSPEPGSPKRSRR